MKQLLAILTALLLALTLTCGAFAEAAAETAEVASEAVGEAAETVEAAAEAAEEAAGEAEKPPETLLRRLFGEFTEVPWYTYALLAVLLIGGAILLFSSKKTAWNSRLISTAAMTIAISFVLSCIRLFRMPQGGSITPASMLPMIMFILACGPLKGFVVGCAYGFLQLISGPYVIHPVQLLVDYPLAYGVMVLGCAAALIRVEARWQLPAAVLFAYIGRLAMAVLSGVVFFAEYAGEQNAFLYSLGYNAAYLGPDMLVCMIVACIPGMTRLLETIRKQCG